MTHYETLGVETTATESDIKAAYRKLARKYHPDQSDEPDAEARFKEISVAYAILIDADARARYDETGDASAKPLTNQAREVICGLVINWMNQYAENPSFCSLTSFLQQQITQQLRAAEKNVEEGDRIVARFELALKRLKFKGEGHDYVRHHIADRIKQVKSQVVLARENVERICLTLELSRDYDYENPFGSSPITTWGMLTNRPL